MELNTIDKKVLYIIMAELSEKNPTKYPEFPELTKKKINNSINKLSKLNLIHFNEKDELWWATDKGIEATNNQKEFEKIIEEFNRNTPHN